MNIAKNFPILSQSDTGIFLEMIVSVTSVAVAIVEDLPTTNLGDHGQKEEWIHDIALQQP